MSPFFIALTITDLLLLGLLVALPVRVHWAVKIIAIVVVLAFNFLAWSSADSGTGWAIKAPLPARAKFVACQVIEPVRIYVWVVPLTTKHGVLSYRPSGDEPRAYSEPYNRSLHEACQTASKAAASGISMGISSPGAQNIAGHYHPYVLPSPKLPRKGR